MFGLGFEKMRTKKKNKTNKRFLWPELTKKWSEILKYMKIPFVGQQKVFRPIVDEHPRV